MIENVERIFGKTNPRMGIRITFIGFLKLICISILGLGIGFVGSIDSLHMKLLEFSMLILSMLIAFQIYAYRTKILVPYILFMWVVSPEIRRLMDWSFQSFSDTSIISLIPYCVSLTLLVPIIKNIKRLDRRIRFISRIMGIALIYGFFIGFLKYGMASVFELLNYFVPFLMLIYASINDFDSDVRDKWLRSFSFLAVIIAAYGIYQYIALPPWDKYWMISAKMNSIGFPEPENFRVFSLLNSPGPTGVFLAFALAVMTIQKKWRSFGIIGMLVVAFALLLTLVRVGWIAYIVMVFVYFFRSHTRNRIKMFFLGILIFLAYKFLLPKLPGANNVMSRLNTFSSIEDDHSFNERLIFFRNILSEVLSNPIGKGLGASGLGVKLTQSTDTLVVFDNGYLNLLYTFGLPLGIAVIFAYVCLFLHLFKLSKTEKVFSPLSFAAISAVLFLLLGSNILLGLSGFILMFIISIAYIPKTSNLGGI